MNRINHTDERHARSQQMVLLATVFAGFTLGGGNLFAQQDFHNWTGSKVGNIWLFNNSSPAGTITASSKSFAAATTNVLMPAITNITVTMGFIVGNPGASIDFNFSPNYAWGKGGQLIIGNIHNYFEYTLSAWNPAGNQIDVNQWTPVADYPYSWNPASKTNRTASGQSAIFSVFDPAASPGSGQGGVLWLAGLKDVTKIRLTLTLAPNEQGGDLILFNIATPPFYERHCSQPAMAFNGKPVKASWDTANCYLKPVTAAATPFIWNNSYYVLPDKSNQCVAGAGSWDGANCYFMTKPTGGFILNDKFYVLPSANTCPLGTLEGAACLVKTAPWGTHAFEWQNAWYFTTLYTCKDGGYDGANCYIMSPPTGTIAFIYNSAFYYAE